MGVYIKGMEMPTNCYGCSFAVEAYEGAGVYDCVVTDSRICKGAGKRDDCPLIPSADVAEVRHGHWYLDNGCAFCSECKNSFTPKIRSQALFCPRCGAKMDGGQDDV